MCCLLGACETDEVDAAREPDRVMPRSLSFLGPKPTLGTRSASPMRSLSPAPVRVVGFGVWCDEMAFAYFHTAAARTRCSWWFAFSVSRWRWFVISGSRVASCSAINVDTVSDESGWEGVACANTGHTPRIGISTPTRHALFCSFCWISVESCVGVCAL